MEKEFINQDLDRAATKTSERDPKKTSIIEIKKALDGVKGIALDTSDEANRVSGLLGFIHLNPDLLAAAIVFRYWTKYVLLDDIPPKARNTSFRKALYKLFSSVRKDEKKYAKLKGDLIRYIIIMELNL